MIPGIGEASPTSVRLDRTESGERLGSLCWLILALAGAVSTALILWLNRGTTFFLDEMVWFSNLAGQNDVESVLQPHNSHLIGTSRVLYLSIISVAGPDYVIFRLLAMASLLLTSVLLYTWAKRRIGVIWALAPAILLLFFGSAWQHVVSPIGFTISFSIALGLGALLMFESRSRRRDGTTALLLVASVFTYTVGLGYLVGVAILVLQRREWRRIWIVLVPLLLYSAWWAWSQKFGQGRTTIANADHVISYVTESAAGAAGALSGASIPFSRFGDSAPISTAPPGAAGWIVLVLLGAAIVWRIHRGGYSSTIFSSLGVVATYWLAAALSDPLIFGSQADAVRYVLPGSVGLLLVVIDAAKGIRLTRGWDVAVVAVVVFSFAMNVVFLRDGASYVRAHAKNVQTDLAMLELGNGWLPGDGATGGPTKPRPEVAAEIPYLSYGPGRDEYIEAVARFGSPAYDLDQIRSLDPDERIRADDSLRQTYGLGLAPGYPPPSSRTCSRVASGSTFRIPAGGVLLHVSGDKPVNLSVSRFSDPPGIPIGTLYSSTWSLLKIPEDAAPDPWRAAPTSGPGITACPIS